MLCSQVQVHLMKQMLHCMKHIHGNSGKSTKVFVISEMKKMKEMKEMKEM